MKDVHCTLVLLLPARGATEPHYAVSIDESFELDSLKKNARCALHGGNSRRPRSWWRFT